MTSRFRPWLKQFRVLVRAKIHLGDLMDRALHGRARRTVRDLPLFAPYSSGSSEARAAHTILAANQAFPFLVHLIGEMGSRQMPDVADAGSLCADPAARATADLLKENFDKHGSDKSTEHDYHYVYGHILRHPLEVRAVVEIGLGSNNRDIVSNMSAQGNPGSSLRAFRDSLPNALVYGADVDRQILFQEDRIATVFVDQTDLHSFQELERLTGNSLDLVIDDGLHSPNANIAVAAFALPRLRPGGWLVVEDIAPDALPVWHVVAALLPAGYAPFLVRARGGFVFCVQRARGSVAPVGAAT